MNINKQRTVEANRRYYKNNPWAGRLRQMRYRCNNKNDARYRNYGGRGIKCFLTMENMKCLWVRDKAYLMENPSIDRIDNNGHYIFDNCRFIELADNISKAHFGKSKPKKLTKKKATAIKKLYATGRYSHRKLAKKFGVCFTLIRHIVIGKIWRIAI